MKEYKISNCYIQTKPKNSGGDKEKKYVNHTTTFVKTQQQ